MNVGDPFLISAISTSQAYPEEWWAPSPDLLAAIESGCTEVKVLAVELESEEGSDLWSACPVWIGIEECDSTRFAGTVIRTEFEREGYREDDRITALLDRVFDICRFDSQGNPILNEHRARFAVGKRALVRVVEESHVGDILECREFVGTVSSVDSYRGVGLKLQDETDFWFPPDIRGLSEACPGEYHLHTTGETVLDPDYVWSWTITRPEGSQELFSKDGFHPSLA